MGRDLEISHLKQNLQLHQETINDFEEKFKQIADAERLLTAKELIDRLFEDLKHFRSQSKNADI